MSVQRIILLGILTVLVVYGHFSERIPSNNQTGWDGKLYADLVVSLDKQWQNNEIDGYLFQRILPSAIGYIYFHKLLNKKDVSRKDAVNFFLWLNTLLIAFAVWGFLLLSRKLLWNLHTEIIGFAALFFNYAILKQAWYYPVLTDIMAFTLGLWLVYFFLSEMYIPSALICIAGAFVYPLFLPTAILLFIHVSRSLFHSKKITYLVRITLLSLLSILLYAYLFYPDQILHPRYIMQVNKSLLPLSVVGLVAYLWHITKPLKKTDLVEEKRLARSIVAFLLLAVFIAIQLYIRKCLPQETNFTATVFGMNIFQQAISNPLAFVIYHTVYVGPMVMLMLVWKWDWVHTKHFLLFVFAYLLLCLGTESRQFINAWPLLVVVFLQTVNSKKLHPLFVATFVVLSLVQSHFFLLINEPGIYETYEYGKFPEQRYFMHHGPFATPYSYVINTSGSVLMALILYLAYRLLHSNSTKEQYVYGSKEEK